MFHRGPPRGTVIRVIQATANQAMTQREYAKRRGVSQAAVSRAVKAGRLKASVAPGGGILDPVLADREWDASTDLTRAPLYVRERYVAHTATAPVADAPRRDPSRGGRPPKARAPEHPAGEAPPVSGEAPPGDNRPRPVVGGGLTENNAAKAYWQALREELDYRKAAGKLVPAADVDAKVRGVFTITRTKLLTLPSRAKLLLGLNAEQVLQLEGLTRELLEELATGRVA